jgi:hypothetical protein
MNRKTTWSGIMQIVAFHTLGTSGWGMKISDHFDFRLRPTPFFNVKKKFPRESYYWFWSPSGILWILSGSSGYPCWTRVVDSILPETGLVTIYFPLSWGHRAPPYICASLICIAARGRSICKDNFLSSCGLCRSGPHIHFWRPAMTHLTFMEKTAES